MECEQAVRSVERGARKPRRSGARCYDRNLLLRRYYLCEMMDLGLEADAAGGWKTSRDVNEPGRARLDAHGQVAIKGETGRRVSMAVGGYIFCPGAGTWFGAESEKQGAGNWRQGTGDRD